MLNDQWHHIAGVYTRSGSSLTIATYLDGVLVGSNTTTVGDISSLTDVRLGHYLAQPYYDGKLDDIRIYERALSAGEINDLATGCGNTSSSASSQSSVASSASSQPCADVSTDDLTGYWKFDEGSGSTIIDSTSYNNQGVLQNGALRNVAAAPTSFGNPSALELDGVDDHALIGDPTGLPNGSTERTVALWVNRAAPTTQGTLVALGNTDDGTQKFIVQLAVVSGDTYLFTDGINGANNITLSGSQIPGAGWHHIAFTKDASDQWQYFLDGVLSKSGSFAVPINTNTNDVEIGSRHDNGNDGFFQGLLDDTRLYNRVLTGTEIQNLADGCGNVSSSASSVSSTASSQSSVDSSVSSSASSQISSVNSSVSSVASSVASSSQASSNNSSSVANIPQCNGQTATVYVKNGLIVGGPQNGQPFNGILNGTNGDDVIVGTAGSDEIHGRNGDDLICARAGSDKVEGDNGKDTIHGGPGSDLLTGNNGQDTVFGGADSDELLGNDGVDVLCGRGQEDFLRGGNGNDRMDGGGSFDYLQGNNGQDACANGESLQSCEQTPSSIPECSAADVN